MQRKYRLPLVYGYRFVCRDVEHTHRINRELACVKNNEEIEDELQSQILIW